MQVEELLNSAAKEGEIETRLQRIKDDWATREFTLGTFKSRGELTLKPDKTSDLMTDIEDSQLVLTALLSNRYNAAFRKEIQVMPPSPPVVSPHTAPAVCDPGGVALEMGTAGASEMLPHRLVP